MIHKKVVSTLYKRYKNMQCSLISTSATKTDNNDFVLRLLNGFLQKIGDEVRIFYWMNRRDFCKTLLIDAFLKAFEICSCQSKKAIPNFKNILINFEELISEDLSKNSEKIKDIFKQLKDNLDGNELVPLDSLLTRVGFICGLSKLTLEEMKTLENLSGVQLSFEEIENGKSLVENLNKNFKHLALRANQNNIQLVRENLEKMGPEYTKFLFLDNLSFCKVIILDSFVTALKYWKSNNSENEIKILCKFSDLYFNELLSLNNENFLTNSTKIRNFFKQLPFALNIENLQIYNKHVILLVECAIELINFINSNDELGSFAELQNNPIPVQEGVKSLFKLQVHFAQIVKPKLLMTQHSIVKEVDNIKKINATRKHYFCTDSSDRLIFSYVKSLYNNFIEFDLFLSQMHSHSIFSKDMIESYSCKVNVPYFDVHKKINLCEEYLSALKNSYCMTSGYGSTPFIEKYRMELFYLKHNLDMHFHKNIIENLDNFRKSLPSELINKIDFFDLCCDIIKVNWNSNQRLTKKVKDKYGKNVILNKFFDEMYSLYVKSKKQIEAKEMEYLGQLKLLRRIPQGQGVVRMFENLLAFFEEIKIDYLKNKNIGKTTISNLEAAIDYNLNCYNTTWKNCTESDAKKSLETIFDNVHLTNSIEGKYFISCVDQLDENINYWRKTVKLLIPAFNSFYQSCSQVLPSISSDSTFWLDMIIQEEKQNKIEIKKNIRSHSNDQDEQINISSTDSSEEEFETNVNIYFETNRDLPLLITLKNQLMPDNSFTFSEMKKIKSSQLNSIFLYDFAYHAQNCQNLLTLIHHVGTINRSKLRTTLVESFINSYYYCLEQGGSFEYSLNINGELQHSLVNIYSDLGLETTGVAALDKVTLWYRYPHYITSFNVNSVRVFPLGFQLILSEDETESLKRLPELIEPTLNDLIRFTKNLAPHRHIDEQRIPELKKIFISNLSISPADSKSHFKQHLEWVEFGKQITASHQQCERYLKTLSQKLDIEMDQEQILERQKAAKKDLMVHFRRFNHALELIISCGDQQTISTLNHLMLMSAQYIVEHAFILHANHQNIQLRTHNLQHYIDLLNLNNFYSTPTLSFISEYLYLEKACDYPFWSSYKKPVCGVKGLKLLDMSLQVSKGSDGFLSQNMPKNSITIVKSELVGFVNNMLSFISEFEKAIVQS